MRKFREGSSEISVNLGMNNFEQQENYFSEGPRYRHQPIKLERLSQQMPVSPFQVTASRVVENPQRS